MADDVENDDQWLYGDNSEQDTNITDPVKVSEPKLSKSKPEEKESVLEDAPKVEDPSENQDEKPVEDQAENQKEDGEEDDDDQQNGEVSDKDDSEEDSDDDINVVIGDIKTSPAYTSLNIKRGGLLTSTAGDKTKQAPQPGKFTVEEFDQMGTINGVPAAEFNLDSLEDKPWRKPGADITDYFNYGFNEDTWRAYCERQKRLRVSESGVGLAPLNAIGLPRGPLPIMNDNSKYSGNFLGVRKAGPPPGRRMTGSIDVIGSGQRVAGALGKLEPPKENVIQVLTADRREYSRKLPGFPDMSVPPPNSFDDFPPEYGFPGEPEPFYGRYEPTQDSQWGNEPDPGWVPQDIKPLTGGPIGPPVLGPPMGMPLPAPSPSLRDTTSPKRDSKDREREVSRSRSEKPRDRDRERSRRRDRSRSRSRRHKSRSRSPGHRSHRKKKARRHEDSD